ncbi:MAG: biotin synthase BioB [Bdellovibrio sp. CG12_big_fil_rev_8_21_14_0_65_39_13]|nr:MAG: biotin synthase BioB [Bdellovibrio sp. CG22_combo_CG10-13_8_21_14_all_39_27]PIQ61526.1 MAG: biotin synthase BioB [Bdellovibrio sp. CG12_big_fil_rev_8_21_14_0_65_39_13]PIR35943.1 MAG: biotin synthase BioB [Bdellovibrio sp. CG11_big_fil_rev_8_21_14_0_20_39_38]
MNIKTDWSLQEIKEIHDLPLLKLVLQAQEVHSLHFKLGEVQMSSLISIKTGGCPEDCGYCPQAARYHTDIKKHPLMQKEEVLSLSRKAKDKGASRICLGAAWREVRDGEDFDKVLEIVKAVSEEGVQVCCTLGMLSENQAQRLKAAGLSAYNHNIDTSEAYYDKVIKTRNFDDRINTIQKARDAGLSVCSGGILGLGESIDDRIKMLQTLSSLSPHPESVPINTLVPVKGTPLEKNDSVAIEELVRAIATARILMPQSFIRLSAGRLERSVSEQALCFLAGANSIFTGDTLLTTPNPTEDTDDKMFRTLGLTKMAVHV